MVTVSMNMSDFSVESETEVITGYEDEIMQTGWLPELVLQPMRSDVQRKIPHDLACEDVSVFLRRMYVNQR